MHNFPHNSYKELIMSLKLSALALAATVTDDLTQYVETELNKSEMKMLIQEKIKQDRLQVMKDAASEVVDLLKFKQVAIESRVNAIRNNRKAIDLAKSELEAIKLATEYGDETNNYLPLARLLGKITPCDIIRLETSTPSITKVPKGFVSTKSLFAKASEEDAVFVGEDKDLNVSDSAELK